MGWTLLRSLHNKLLCTKECIMHFRLILILFILIIISPICNSASFDCDKASSNTEKLICSDSKLSALDKTLGEIYKSLKAENNEEQNRTLKVQQRTWIKERNSQCTSLGDCNKIYFSRISKLRHELKNKIALNGFIFERQNCRSAKNQEVLIQCVNKKVYDPCEDSGGSWGASQCGWIHTEIASRKIKDIEMKIIKAIKHSKSHTEALKNFNNSTQAWNAYLAKHCEFTNTADDLENFSSMHLHLAFCKRRLSEQRVAELKNVLSRAYAL